MTNIFAVFLVIVGTIIGSFGALFLKQGSASFSLNIKGVLRNWRVLLGLFLYGVSTIPFIYALKFGDVSVLYPVTSLTNIWVCLLGQFVLKERMNVTKWVGIALIINGVISISV
ncbi:EamA family transporter [Candidatus Woesearchaeota archaeon]|nr:EamA family transporter [Candidatus Woesearchaeota archaeon]